MIAKDLNAGERLFGKILIDYKFDSAFPLDLMMSAFNILLNVLKVTHLRFERLVSSPFA
jgi:hypothetical protein